MGVSFGEVVGDVQPDDSETRESARAAPEAHAAQLEPVVLRREMTRLRRRDARLRAT